MVNLSGKSTSTGRTSGESSRKKEPPKGKPVLNRATLRYQDREHKRGRLFGVLSFMASVFLCY